MFTIDNMSGIPVYEQIVRQVEELVLSRKLKAGDALPSVRGLATELGVNPNTIQKSYAELEHRGMIASVPGRGSFLREDALKQLIAYLNANVLPEFKNMLRSMLVAGATKEDAMNYISDLLDEIEKEGVN